MENGLIMGRINEYFRNIDIFNEVNSLIYIEELKIELLNELCKRMDEPIDLIDKPNSTNFGIGLQNLFTILFFSRLTFILITEFLPCRYYLYTWSDLFPFKTTICATIKFVVKFIHSLRAIFKECLRHFVCK